MNDAAKTHYIVKTSAAYMPATCWGTYRRVAVLEVDVTQDSASMISTRAKGVRRIVETWEKLNVGTTDRCAYQRALDEAYILCHQLNEGRQSA